MGLNKRIKRTALATLTVVGLAGAFEVGTSVHMNQLVDRATTSVKADYQYNYNYQDGAAGLTGNQLVGGNFKLNHAAAAIAFNAKTGKIVFAKNVNKRMKVASTAKLMTLYLVLRKAQETNGWNQVVDTSNAGLRAMGNNANVGGGFKFVAGKKYTVKQLYRATLIQSSNNAAIALGQWVAGSNAKFIQMMNKQAQAWGLKAKFNSASGLENNDLAYYGFKYGKGATTGNMLSAKDLAVITQHVLAYYPQILNDAKKRTAKVAGQNLYNYNNLLKGRAFYDESLSVDGLKTGYTPAAGLCFVGTGQVAGKDRLVTITLNDPYEFSDQRDLMRYIYKNSSAF